MSAVQDDDDSNVPTYTSAFPPLLTNGKPENEHVVRSWENKNNLAVRSSTITQVLSLPLEERQYKSYSNGNVFGKQSNLAKICNDIMLKTNVTMERSFSKDKCLTIIITGKPDSVQHAKKQLTAKLTPQVSISIQIPKEHYRYLLGAHGKKLAQIEVDTSTKITIPSQQSTSDLVTIVGTRDGVEKARHELQMISDEQAKLASTTLNIPREFHAFINGPNNETYKQLVNKTGAKIVIPSLSSGKDEIYVSGGKENVATAIEDIKRIYEEKKRTCKTISVEVPKSQHKYIIGSHGNHINEIFKETGVYIEIPPPNSLSSTITLRGDSDKLGVALTSVYERANSMSFREINVPSWLHRFIIGAKGAHIKKINSEFPKVHIELSDDTIKIEGPTKECEQVEYEIGNAAKNLVGDDEGEEE
ncbi:hypothetical protein HELRODRAFT_180768 [Helobdella robusta]|uniref:K Homology domain-containing protein n=1 Tax=Helobdella robusta TaxID=6412 RepID=T1FG93_HELRO|nr:hypothetical protein HELRODRAFT_180768 [Helobdella robusta]ESN93673.1 hypothetical protein HELRODRAFT_180768 [Helobdella robusta]